VRDAVRIAVRYHKPNGKSPVVVLISTLTPAEVGELTGVDAVNLLNPTNVLLAHVYLYDQRSGGVETSFKGDKQGLGLSKRTKKRFEAQQMVMLLGSLAHNVIVWVRNWLAASACKLQHYGMLRIVRDIFRVSGFLLLDALGRIRQIVLNQEAPFALILLAPLRELLACAHVAIQAGPT
jgi:hypothetical protein